MSALTVSAAAGGIEMNSGSLHRYLAEAVWYPSALLPGPRQQWTPVDATRALATLTNDRTSVSLEFRFAESGDDEWRAVWKGMVTAYLARTGD
jgi:hypothetical protein